MRKAMKEAIPDKEQRQEYIEWNNERKTTNKIRRKVRLARKAYLQEWSFFCPFTYSDKLHTEVYLPHIDRINVDVKLFRNDAFHYLDMIILKQGRIILKNYKFV